ncbi:hypothetical protein ACIA8O_09035 [Kitasatospora sp. NPDC051853]|uniref:hypothetical protein n=1 Tax=Kitasatospora sp. NPDC051853 TaxID=3364058 RepID=UPI0037927824
MEEQDRPAVSAVRLERMFDGLRSEVTTLRMPSSEELLCRAVRRRRRRRAGIVAVTGALTSAGVWGLATFCGPGEVGGQVAGLAGLPVERTIAPTLLLPGPVELAGGADAVMPVADGGRELLLGQAGLPVAEGRYGPWGPLLAGASTSGQSATQGCVPRIVELLEADRRWELVRPDEGRGLAVQYLLEFDGAAAAAGAEQRLLEAAECTVPGAGWVAGERTHRAVALRTFEAGSDGPERVEELAVRLAGRQLALMLVQYTTDSTPTGLAGAVLDPEFREASEAFAALPSPVPPVPPVVPSASGSRSGTGN